MQNLNLKKTLQRTINNYAPTFLRNLFFRKPGGNSAFSGSLYPLGYTRQNRQYNLEIPYRPVRPILNNTQNSIELLEMATWSYELRHSISNLSRDCFQSENGAISSWQVSDTFQEKKVHADVKAIARDLANRQNNKEYVLGGNRLRKACADMLFYGDSFVELAIEKDGISKEYGISRSLYLPSLSTFVDVDEQENILSYSQREYLFPKATDLYINPLKVLHFSYEKNQIYGEPIGLQSLNAWRILKGASDNLEQAAIEAGNSILVHSLPEGTTETARQTYQQRHETTLAQGIITNLYLMPGTEVERIANNAGALEPLIKNWLLRRYECIPPGIPLYFFPGLGMENAGARDISGQPALNYARMIAYIRSVIGEQVKYAINLEIILKRGYDWFLENGKFDLVWEPWINNVFDGEEKKK